MFIGSCRRDEGVIIKTIAGYVFTVVSQWLVGPEDGIDFDVFKSDYLCLACHVHYKLVISRDDGTGRVAAVALLCSRFSNQHKRQKRARKDRYFTFLW